MAAVTGNAGFVVYEHLEFSVLEPAQFQGFRRANPYAGRTAFAALLVEDRPFG
jgi:hypothetical protein